MKSRNSYGWGASHGMGSTGRRSQKDMEKWQVAYRCKDGGFGIIGYVPLFDKKSEAIAFGEKYKRDNSYVADIIIQHPSKCYSTY